MDRAYLDALYDQLARDLNCDPADFRKSDDVLTVPALREGRRQYSPDAPFFQMVTLGGNAVISADPQLHPFLEKLCREKQGHWLFELPPLFAIDAELRKFGFSLMPTHFMFLPDGDAVPESALEVRWFYDQEIHPFYGDTRFPNAICPAFLPERPDRIVVCAYDDGQIMGMAGCSEDAPHWQQIGIDVLPAYRGKGVGSTLVTLLKNRILEQGDIPFYGTAAANYASMQTALRTGFRPVWTEINSIRFPSAASDCTV